MHDISILNHVIFSLAVQFSDGTAGGFALEGDEIFILNNLGPDEPLFEIGMYDTRRLRSLVPFVDCPGTAFVGTCRENVWRFNSEYAP